MSNRLGGKQGTAYRGTNAIQPPNWRFEKRDPTPFDIYDVVEGDLWLNQVSEEAFLLLSLKNDGVSGIKGAMATWVMLTGSAGALLTLTGNSGGVVSSDINGNIDVVGDGITVDVVGDPANNRLTISSIVGMPWTDVILTSQQMAVNNGYSANNGALVTLTLPVTAAFGDRVAVVGNGVGGWSIAQNAGQTIHFNSGDTTPGVGGSLSSTVRYNAVELLCTVANTDWVVRNASGNLTIV
jgi:hypothetical protein